MPLHLKTVTPALKEILYELMDCSLFKPFRLVGGTNLCLRFGYRLSSDIDLFTDAEYESIDFNKIENFLQSKFPFYDCNDKQKIVGMGRAYYIGYDENNIIKLDLMYENDPFLRPEETIEGIRMADVEEIAIMKLDAIYTGGRKKDCWELHYLLFDLGMDLYYLIQSHSDRFPYTHDYAEMIQNLLNFDKADNEPDPICLLGKSWDLIRMDIIDSVSKLPLP